MKFVFLLIHRTTQNKGTVDTCSTETTKKCAKRTNESEHETIGGNVSPIQWRDSLCCRYYTTPTSKLWDELHLSAMTLKRRISETYSFFLNCILLVGNYSPRNFEENKIMYCSLSLWSSECLVKAASRNSKSYSECTK